MLQWGGESLAMVAHLGLGRPRERIELPAEGAINQGNSYSLGGIRIGVDLSRGTQRDLLDF